MIFPPKALIVDKQGDVWTSSRFGKLVKYDSRANKLEYTEILLPAQMGRHILSSVSALLLDPETGMIYGGTDYDGYLFSFNPKSGELKDLGKPIAQGHVRGLALGLDGMLYGTVGGHYTQSTFFQCNPRDGSFHLFGGLWTTINRTNYNWMSHFLGPVACDRQGLILIGEKDRIGHVITYWPHCLRKPQVIE